MEVINQMLVEPTGHSIIDSGGIYGRSYQMNATREFSKEPQAVFKDGMVSISVWHHINACLERNSLCEAFDLMNDGSNWNSDFYGCTQQQQEFLEDIGASVGEGWNTYNWDNNFDQVLQGHDVEINGDDYVLLQIHGGCDVRSGYTSARLFKIQTWMKDYWLDDTSEFCIPRSKLEPMGYPTPPTTEYDYVVIEIGFAQVRLYDPNLQDEPDFDLKPWDLPDGVTIEGTQRAVEH